MTRNTMRPGSEVERLLTAANPRSGRGFDRFDEGKKVFINICGMADCSRESTNAGATLAGAQDGEEINKAGNYFGTIRSFRKTVQLTAPA